LRAYSKNELTMEKGNGKTRDGMANVELAQSGTATMDYLIEGSEEAVQGKGRNIIPEVEKEPLWKAYLEKFKDPIIIILLVALGLSLGVSVYEMANSGRDASCLIEPLGVLVAILLATGIGFIFEVKAEKEFKILNKAKDERPVKVLRLKRAGDKTPQTYEVPKSDVCVGDVVVLENGDEVPADGLLLSDRNLTIDESNFTGEPFTKKKAESKIGKKVESALQNNTSEGLAKRDNAEESTYPENFLLRGTTVIEGSATYKVMAVGTETEEGKGARILQEEADVETPLNAQLNQLAKWITYASYIIAALIVVGRMSIFFLTNDAGAYSFIEVFRTALNSLMIAVTLIVVAVPEGLPMSVTISLALSMRKMLKEKNLVRKLHACETLGATTVICTDKTGTLTKNKMSVVESEFWGVDESLIADSIAVNSTAALNNPESGEPHAIGNPTEGALLLWLQGKGVDYSERRNAYRIVDQIAFSTERKRMTTDAVDSSTGKEYLFIKGAPELLLETSDIIEGGPSKETVLATLAAWQAKGMRTLGFAFRNISAQDSKVTFIGIVGIADPIREDVKEAIDTCSGHAGIRVIMVTGDNALTASEIARQAGIINKDETNPLTITGSEFTAKSDEYLKKEVLPTLRVLSRARPEDKVRLVSLLQEMGEVVAVTGDGTNDAPALKKAQVGLSMGDGTARAKEASDITIIDNSFSSIGKGILWGRSLYLNIKRFILFQMTINVCACLIVLLGAFIGLDSPLTVTQMLWVNLIMDTFAAMALSSIPPDRKVMDEKPRDQKSHIIDRKMGVRIAFSGIFFFAFLALLWQLLWRMDISSVRDLLHWNVVGEFFRGAFSAHTKAHLSGYELGVFFTTFVLLQFWNLFNSRYFKTDGSVLQDILDFFFNRKRFKASACYGCLLVAGIILFGQFLIVNCFGAFFEVSPLPLTDWGWILLCTSPVLILPDLYRFIRSKVAL